LPPVEARYWPAGLAKSSGVAGKKFTRQRAGAMNLSKTPSPAAGREERLAQRLRENLRRRKAQARALSQTQEEMAPSGGENGGESA